MATHVKNLNKKNGRMAVEVIDAPYKEELVITSVKTEMPVLRAPQHYR